MIALYSVLAALTAAGVVLYAGGAKLAVANNTTEPFTLHLLHIAVPLRAVAAAELLAAAASAAGILTGTLWLHIPLLGLAAGLVAEAAKLVTSSGATSCRCFGKTETVSWATLARATTVLAAGILGAAGASRWGDVTLIETAALTLPAAVLVTLTTYLPVLTQR